MPTPSCPGVKGGEGLTGQSPCAAWMSVWQRPDASSLTTISPVPATGLGSSSIVSGSVKLCTTAARMVVDSTGSASGSFNVVDMATSFCRRRSQGRDVRPSDDPPIRVRGEVRRLGCAIVSDEFRIDDEFQIDEAERLGPAPPVGEPRLRRVARGAVVDLGPLRHRDFRLLWIGQAVSFFGSMITFVAIPYQAYQLSRSSLVVGLLGIVELVPLLVTALVGGALADTVDRRRLVQIAEASLALASGLLLVNALLPDPQLWVLFVVGALMAGLEGILRPPLDALLPRLVEKDELSAAGAGVAAHAG